MSRTNILLEGYDIDAAWLRESLGAYIKPEHKVAVIPFAFRDSRVKTAQDWDGLYSKDSGRFFGGIVGAFASYGIPADNVTFLNYFTDSKETARDKIAQADILHFPGGLPDRMMARLAEFELADALLSHDGIVMGYSAGAVIQLAEYHLSPDEDYTEFGYYRGIPYLDGFYHEVHFENSEQQLASIRRVVRERGKPVYATHRGKGALIAKDGRVTTLGAVDIFTP